MEVHKNFLLNGCSRDDKLLSFLKALFSNFAAFDLEIRLCKLGYSKKQLHFMRKELAN